MIPEHLLQQIAERTDIVDLIGSYFPLKKAGPAYKACCPFHQEKTASFNVNPARQIFKCFGCGAGGGVFKFVELYESVNFPEAVKRLAARAGITIEEEPLSVEEDAERRLRQRLLALHAEAAEWFHLNLLRTKAGQVARDYLKSRGITGDVAKSWKLGYAPESWDALTDMARGRGFREEEIIASGLVTFKVDEQGRRIGDPYDRFRDRLMFPICNDLGEVIAFSGRVLNKEAFGGKYVNSPETPLFIKGKVLFGLHQAKRAIINKSAAIVCEGQLDLITAFEAGIQNVTAPQGTAFTEQQAHIIRRLTGEAGEVILCFDADNAGLNAAEKSLPHLLAEGLSVRVAQMPAGHDPDSLIRTEGPEAFAAQIAAARDFFEFQIERHVASPDFATPKGKTAFASKMADSVKRIADPVLRQAVINNVSSRLEMPAAQFAALVRRKANEKQPRRPEESPAHPANQPEPSPELPPLSTTTRLLCQLCLLDAATRDWVQAQPWQELFAPLPEAELLGKVVTGRYDPAEPASVTVFLTTLRPEEEAMLADLLDLKQLPPEPLQIAADCLRDLERRNLTQLLGAIQARLRAPKLAPDEIDSLQRHVMQVTQQLAALRP